MTKCQWYFVRVTHVSIVSLSLSLSLRLSLSLSMLLPLPLLVLLPILMYGHADLGKNPYYTTTHSRGRNRRLRGQRLRTSRTAVQCPVVTCRAVETTSRWFLAATDPVSGRHTTELDWAANRKKGVWCGKLAR